ncbi:expressed unknown protein [Seminavis robusta]|uniref:Uncharacterized protein n=1 Tax=Seminavis robusta TaxID=568900 RepID=A0A9N8E2V3_9STRA|nr:expressed unknown protein [Seminavis robusta]|eukprot:Sro561_g166820.1 n/a (148) ;mRNA; f:37119-37562
MTSVSLVKFNMLMFLVLAVVTPEVVSRHGAAAGGGDVCDEDTNCKTSPIVKDPIACPFSAGDGEVVQEVGCWVHNCLECDASTGGCPALGVVNAACYDVQYCFDHDNELCLHLSEEVCELLPQFCSYPAEELQVAFLEALQVKGLEL